MKKIVYVFLLAFIFIGYSATVWSDENEQKLFVNLTTDDLDRAAMAVSLATKVLSTQKIPVTIFLNAQGVRWADKNIPQNRYANGKTIPEMLQKFMESGGQVILCKMCMKNVGGMSEAEVIKGIKFDGAFSALFADDTTVISY
jgi:predicted peroxiredoxin